LTPTFTYTGGQKFYNGNPKTFSIAATNTEVASFAMGTGNFIMQFNLTITGQPTRPNWANILLTTPVGGNPPQDTRYPSFWISGTDSSPNQRRILFSCYQEGTLVPTIADGTVATFQAIQFNGQIQLNVFTNGTLFFQWTAAQTNLTSAAAKLYMPGIPNWNPGSANGLITITNLQFVVDGVTINPNNATGTGGMGTYAFTNIVLNADGFPSTAGTASATIATPLYSAKLTNATIATNQSFFGMTLQAQGGIPGFTGTDGYAYTCTAVSSSDNNYLNRLAISTSTSTNLGSTQPSLGLTYTLAVGIQINGVVGPLIEFFGLADVKDVTNLTNSVTSPQTASSGSPYPGTGATVYWTAPILPAGSTTSYYTYKVYTYNGSFLTLVQQDIPYGTTSASIPNYYLVWGSTNIIVVTVYKFGTFTKQSPGTSPGANTTVTVYPSSGGIIEQTTQGTKTYILPYGNYTITLTWYLVGGGGAGGSQDGIYGGGGGGGGGYSSQSTAVYAGSVITITTGAGGAFSGGAGGGSAISGGGINAYGAVGGGGGGDGHTDGWVGNNHPGGGGGGGWGWTNSGPGGNGGNNGGNNNGAAGQVNGGWDAHPEYGRSGAGQGNGGSVSGSDGYSGFTF
jgi:hypothetical protein